MPPGYETDSSPLAGYRLEELLSEDGRARTWRARQHAMKRSVVLEILNEELSRDQEVVSGFLNDLRARAAIDHTSIGSVYEAGQDGETVFSAREWLAGESLGDLRAAGRTFDPVQVVALLRQLGGAMEYLEERGVANRPLECGHLVLGDRAVLRIVNPALAGRPDPAVAARDRHLVAELFLDLLERGHPGATRTTRLLGMMADPATPLSWTQIAHTARKLEQDLQESLSPPHPEAGLGRFSRDASPRFVGLLMVCLAVAALVAAASFLLSRGDRRPQARELSGMVEVPAGTHRTPAGAEIALARFWIDRHEVTIAEYEGFLEALAALEDGSQHRAYDHPEQPSTKSGHLPDDWESLLAAARAGGTWQGLPVDLNHPVVNVDWWDAHAYASWRAGRLPTQEEWFAAADDGLIDPAPWGPVDAAPADVTTRGVHGMAGNVTEWVRDPAKNPAYPMNPKAPLVCGASYLQPRNGIRSREWLPGRDVRRQDLGFRIVRETAP